MDGVVIVDGAPSRCLGLKIHWSRFLIDGQCGGRVRADGVMDRERRFDLGSPKQAQLTRRCLNRWLRSGAPGLRITYSPSVGPTRWFMALLSVATVAFMLFVFGRPMLAIFGDTFWLDLAGFVLLLMVMLMALAPAMLLTWWAWRLDATVRKVTITDAGGTVEHRDARTVDWRWSEIESLRRSMDCFMVHTSAGTIQLPAPPRLVKEILSHRVRRKEPKPSAERWSLVRQWCYAVLGAIAMAAVTWWMEGSWPMALLTASLAAAFLMAFSIAAHLDQRRRSHRA